MLQTPAPRSRESARWCQQIESAEAIYNPSTYPARSEPVKDPVALQVRAHCNADLLYIADSRFSFDQSKDMACFSG